MNASSFEETKRNLLQKLQGLDTKLSYHSVYHTLDVVKQAERIAIDESITDLRSLYLLKLAALYHDSGFLFAYTGHEEKGCEIFVSDSVKLNLSENEIHMVTDLIMATKLTNTPETALQKIIRDADVDYLGRHDFFDIATLLKQELLSYHFIANEKEWNQQQETFLKNHQYYTRSSQMLREPVKQENLNFLLA